MFLIALRSVFVYNSRRERAIYLSADSIRKDIKKVLKNVVQLVVKVI